VILTPKKRTPTKSGAVNGIITGILLIPGREMMATYHHHKLGSVSKNQNAIRPLNDVPCWLDLSQIGHCILIMSAIVLFVFVFVLYCYLCILINTSCLCCCLCISISIFSNASVFVKNWSVGPLLIKKVGVDTT
jgi:hypothetical protein